MRRLTLLPVLAALLTLAACSGGTSPAPAATTAASAPAGGGASAPAGGASAPAGGGAACASAPAGSTAAVTVTIKDFKFSPQPVQAKVGDVVAWTNQDGSTPHSATMDTAGCDTNTINGGATAMLVFSQPGTYTYHCSIHPTQMKDYTVVVQ
jgi:plastocyanin